MPDGPPIYSEELDEGLVRWTTKAHGTELKYVTTDQRPFQARSVYCTTEDGWVYAEGVEIVNADGHRRAVSLWYYDETPTGEEAPLEDHTQEG